MTADIATLKQRFIRMTVISTSLILAAVGFAVAHFVYGVGWALWGFVGFLALGFGAQMWFVHGFGRAKKGN